ncbi:hypothetical protein DENSPDRAFT_327503 [Dentipellis sp. KUC8613]|nr:hypothetical protein DENSPDRAFT_327503 [Dentipellis sp. KUC8613]
MRSPVGQSEEVDARSSSKYLVECSIDSQRGDHDRIDGRRPDKGTHVFPGFPGHLRDPRIVMEEQVIILQRRSGSPTVRVWDTEQLVYAIIVGFLV